MAGVLPFKTTATRSKGSTCHLVASRGWGSHSLQKRRPSLMALELWQSQQWIPVVHDVGMTTQRLRSSRFPPVIGRNIQVPLPRRVVKFRSPDIFRVRLIRRWSPDYLLLPAPEIGQIRRAPQADVHAACLSTKHPCRCATDRRLQGVRFVKVSCP
jgi:hypothetical protein